MATSSPSRRSIPVPESTAARVAAITALLAALAGLVKVGLDIYNAVLATPVGESERTNESKFKEHFGKLPLVEQPVMLRDRNDTTEMLVQVYHNGDVLVRYSGIDRWLPYKSAAPAPPPKKFSLLASANAQPASAPAAAAVVPRPSAPTALPEGKRPPITVDLEAYRRAAAVRAATGTVATAPTSKFALSDIQYSSGGFSKSTRVYEKVFPAAPGHKITSFDLQPASLNNAQIRSAQIVDGGKALRVEYSLTSGPLFDQYRGWIHATISVDQGRD